MTSLELLLYTSPSVPTLLRYGVFDSKRGNRRDGLQDFPLSDREQRIVLYRFEKNSYGPTGKSVGDLARRESPIQNYETAESKRRMMIITARGMQFRC